MPSNFYSQVLAQLNWNINFVLPVANEENRALECEIQKQEEKLKGIQKHFDDNDAKVSLLLEHQKNVRQELHYTLYLIQVRKKDIQSEQHLTMIFTQERDRHQREILKLEKEINRISECSHMFEVTLVREGEKLNNMQSALNLDAETLESWLDERKRRENDAAILRNYSSEDETTVKQLEIKMDLMMHKLYDLQKSLDREKKESLSSEMELDRTADVFRKLHSDQRRLIKRLEEILDQMKMRDSQIQHGIQQIVDAKGIVSEAEKRRREKERFYQMEVDSNAAVQKTIDVSVKNSGIQKIELQKQENVLNELAAELKMLKMMVTGTDEKLNLIRSETVGLKSEIKKKSSVLVATERAYHSLKPKLSRIQKSALSAEEKVNDMDVLLKNIITERKALRIENNRLDSQLFEATGKKQKMIAEEKMISFEIDNLQRLILGLTYTIKHLDDVALKVEKALYNDESKRTALNKRIDRLQGELIDKAEVVELEAKVRALKKELQAQRSTHMLVEKQQKLLKEEISHSQKLIMRYSSEKHDLAEKRFDLELTFNHYGRELTRLISLKQDLMADYNLLKVRAEHLCKTLGNKVSGVFQLEKERLTLESAFAEHSLIISEKQRLLSAAVRESEKERSKILRELQLKFALTLRMKQRFEISISVLETNSENHHEDHQHYQYFTMKRVLEKEELMQEGDCLDEKIKKSEKELEALRNTVAVLSCQNSLARQSLRPVSQEAMQETQQLERQLASLMLKLRQRRKQIAEVRGDKKVVCRTVVGLHEEMESWSGAVKEKEKKFCKAKREAECIQERLKRTDQQNKRLLREVRAASKVIHELPEEIDIRVRVLREMNRNALKQLDKVADEYPEINTVKSELCLQAGLLLSQRSSSSINCGSRSNCSSRSSCCSSRSSFRSKSNLSLEEKTTAGHTSPTVKKSHLHKGKASSLSTR